MKILVLNAGSSTLKFSLFDLAGGEETERAEGMIDWSDGTRPAQAQLTARGDEHPHRGVEPVLREWNIPSSTYYRWRQAETEPCERRRRDAELTGRIRQVHDESGGIYGSPRVHAVLKREGVYVVLV